MSITTDGMRELFPYPLLPLATKSNSQLLPLSGGDAELVKVSEMVFKLGDVPCIFGEYNVEDAILLGDPIPESTECGWILFWPVTGVFELGNWPVTELAIEDNTVILPLFPIWPLWVADCCPLIPFPDGLRTAVTMAEPLLAVVVIHVLFGVIVAAEDTTGPWHVPPADWCWTLTPFSPESTRGAWKLAGDWNDNVDDVVVAATPRLLGEVKELSPIFIWFPENVILGELIGLDGAVGCVETDADTVLTSTADEFWGEDDVVVMLEDDIELDDAEQEVEEEQVDVGDTEGIL